MDLPRKHCYLNNNCENEYNCGELCPQDVDNPDVEQCPGGLFKGECHGLDANHCQGILPELNHRGQLQGTPVLGMDFKRSIDKLVDCSDVCWSGGGADYVRKQCEEKIGTNEKACRAMQYFCDWDSNRKMCTVLQDNVDPLTQYKEKYNTVPPPVRIINIRDDCQGLSQDECLEVPGYSDAYITSAQSSWNSGEHTSYDPNTRIECLHDGGKVCINLPRCSLVEKACECGYVDGKYLCAPKSFVVNTGNDIVQGSGYCTWCGGWMDSGVVEKDCGDRCGGENMEEVVGSEELWDGCIPPGSSQCPSQDSIRECEEKLGLEGNWYHTCIESDVGIYKQNYLCREKQKETESFNPIYIVNAILVVAFLFAIIF